MIEVRNYENSDFLGDFREKYSGKLDRRKALEQMFYGNLCWDTVQVVNYIRKKSY